VEGEHERQRPVGAVAVGDDDDGPTLDAADGERARRPRGRGPAAPRGGIGRGRRVAQARRVAEADHRGEQEGEAADRSQRRYPWTFDER
jgi:hypothetical protein